MSNAITWDDFLRVDLRIGTIVAVEPFPEAKKPAYKLSVDLGPDLGVRRSSSQLTHLYTPDELLGKQVLAVVNFAPKKIGPFLSEILVTGFYDSNGHVVLAQPERAVPNGTRLL